jgi:hypothetical protein
MLKPFQEGFEGRVFLKFKLHFISAKLQAIFVFKIMLLLKKIKI